MELRQVVKSGNSTTIALTGFVNVGEWFDVQKNETTGKITLTPVQKVET